MYEQVMYLNSCWIEIQISNWIDSIAEVIKFVSVNV